MLFNYVAALGLLGQEMGFNKVCDMKVWVICTEWLSSPIHILNKVSHQRYVI